MSLTLLRSLSRYRHNLMSAQANVRRISTTTALPQRLPRNFGVHFVPQQEAWVVERMGKYLRVLEPGVNFLYPVFDAVRYVQSLKELAIEIPSQAGITKDNVTITLDAVLYVRVLDPYKASYGVENVEFAITQMAQTTMRSELGKISLDKVFQERENLNISIVDTINAAGSAWGIACLRYEIRDIRLHARVQEALQMQVEAERKKRAAILDSEGVKEAAINVAAGNRQSRILASEAVRMEQINIAEGKAKGIRIVSEALSCAGGMNAASLEVAVSYIKAFEKLAKENNTILLPSNINDISGTIGSAVSIYEVVSKSMNKQMNPPNKNDD